jgi:hypothetical protein
VARVLPILIVIEGAQFLDPVTIMLPQALARQSQPAGLIVLLMDSDQPSREEANVPGETERLAKYRDRTQRLVRIRIEPLPADEMVASLSRSRVPGWIRRCWLVSWISPPALPGSCTTCWRRPPLPGPCARAAQVPPIWPRSPGCKACEIARFPCHCSAGPAYRCEMRESVAGFC